MITMEGKLEVFTKLVLEKVQQEYEAKKREIDQSNNRIITKHREEINEKAKKIIDNMASRGEIEKNRMISKAKIDKKRAILRKKEELLDKLINKIEKLATRFTYEDNYKSYFENSIYEVLDNLKNKDSITLFVTDKDRSKFSETIKKILQEKNSNTEKVTIQSMDTNLIGGVIAIDAERTIKVDASIKTKIDDNRNLIGQMLYRALDSEIL